MRLRPWTAALATGLVMTFGGVAAAAPAIAAPPPQAATSHRGSITSEPVACLVNSAPTTCTATITSFHVVDGVINAVGTLTAADGRSLPFDAPVVVDPPVCTILDLTLGPLDLNLLGLRIQLNQVHLLITAVPGDGNLLGNLLCSVTHLLDSPGNPLAAITNLLNQILAAL